MQKVRASDKDFLYLLFKTRCHLVDNISAFLKGILVKKIMKIFLKCESYSEKPDGCGILQGIVKIGVRSENQMRFSIVTER